mmetsp:Transcript_14591/g.34649  ORF Transcript_14591/g.34649 Transcript_14591/m.34649 type:complete len:256 (-) Transcript_14591:145-912(-)
MVRQLLLRPGAARRHDPRADVSELRRDRDLQERLALLHALGPLRAGWPPDDAVVSSVASRHVDVRRQRVVDQCARHLDVSVDPPQEAALHQGLEERFDGRRDGLLQVVVLEHDDAAVLEELLDRIHHRQEALVARRQHDRDAALLLAEELPPLSGRLPRLDPCLHLDPTEGVDAQTVGPRRREHFCCKLLVLAVRDAVRRDTTVTAGIVEHILQATQERCENCARPYELQRCEAGIMLLSLDYRCLQGPVFSNFQ